MKKYLAVSLTLMFSAMYSVAQDTRDHIVKALTDPKSAESSAKADAMLIDHKFIKNNSSYQTKEPSSNRDNKRVLKRKKISPKRVL